MLKKFKYVNVICIVLAVLVLILAISVGFVALSALRDQSYDDLLDGFEEKVIKETVPPPIVPTENPLPYRVRSDKTVEAVYLRLSAFGNYNGSTNWLAATPYTELIDGKYPATYLGSKSLDDAKRIAPYALEISPNQSPVVIPSYTATSLLGTPYEAEYPIPTDDVSSSTISGDYYRMYYYDYNNVVVRSVDAPEEYADYEERYRSFVYENYLAIDDESKEYMLKLISEQEIDVNLPNVAEKIAEYVKSVGDYSLAYDVALDNEPNVAIAFAETYKSGTCKHFATLATLMFRSIGIPARYIVGYVTETVQGEWVQLTNLDAHAWVEIYVPGFGWKVVDATPERTSNEITIKPVDVKKLYDGLPLYPEQKLANFEELEEKGYTYEVTVSGERTEPGKSESKIESFKLFDANGQDVTSKFSVTYETGDIQVYIGEITLMSGDADYIYNGLCGQSNLDLCEAYITDGVLGEGHNYSYSAMEMPSNIGNYPHAYRMTVLNAEGEDVSDFYTYKYSFGVFSVTLCKLVLKADSATAVFDPNSTLTCNTYTIVDGALADGDRIDDSSIKITGEQRLPGASDNIIDISSIKILNANDEDVTANYTVSVLPGTLTVFLEE